MANPSVEKEIHISHRTVYKIPSSYSHITSHSAPSVTYSGYDSLIFPRNPQQQQQRRRRQQRRQQQQKQQLFRPKTFCPMQFLNMSHTF